MTKVIKAWGPGPRSLAYYERVPLEEIAERQGSATPEMILEEARLEAEQKVRDVCAEGHRRGVEAGRAE
ncbi:MAG: hypothetical protein NTU83_02990 [Candidatus Hydrogenedentes bacterium]|nr:hypothetical protein [Candidatus Hydrogenedentota bacterium]